MRKIILSLSLFLLFVSVSLLFNKFSFAESTVTYTAPYTFTVSNFIEPDGTTICPTNTIRFFIWTGTGGFGSGAYQWSNYASNLGITSFPYTFNINTQAGDGSGGSPTYASLTEDQVYSFLYKCDDSNTGDQTTFTFASGSPTPTPSTPFIKATPSTSVVTVGTPFNITVGVDGDSTAFNAAQATVNVSSNLTVTGLHNASSNACNLQYTETPSISNLSFAGAIYGSSSTNCNVYTLTLIPNSVGTGTITFTNASMKSYDDNSEILNSVQNGSFTITAGPTPTPTPGLTGLTFTSFNQTYLTSFDLTGTKDSSTTHIFINGSEDGVSFPTSTTWTKTVTLSIGDNNFIAYGTDDNGIQTATITDTVNRHTLGDIDGNGVIDLTDASLFAVDWGKTDPNTFTYNLSDMNNDGQVDLTDLSILAKLISD